MPNSSFPTVVTPTGTQPTSQFGVLERGISSFLVPTFSATSAFHSLTHSRPKLGIAVAQEIAEHDDDEISDRFVVVPSAVDGT